MSELSDLTIKVAPRDQTGRQACNKLRASGRIPAILYGKEINKSVSLEDRSMRILLRKASGTSSLLRLLGEEGEDDAQKQADEQPTMPLDAEGKPVILQAIKKAGALRADVEVM